MGLIYCTDWNIKGSGYFSIGYSFIPALTKAKDEHIIVLGMNYFGQEYRHDYPVVPTEFSHIPQRIKHIVSEEDLNIDKVVVALDLPLQMHLLTSFPRQQRPFRYIGIFPLDGGPLVREWAMIIGEMNDAFVISQFAHKCCKEAGLEVNYLPVAAPTKWYVHTDFEDRQALRTQHGVDDKFLILTIADNHERKNLAGAMEMVAGLAKRYDNIEYWVVTRMGSRIGWQLESLARELGIRKITHFFDRVLKPELLFVFYSCADVLLHPVKAEGLGMPILEAQVVGTIPIATRTSAIIELIEQGGGLFIEPEYRFIDPFGNTKRAFPSMEDGVKKLEMLYHTPEQIREMHRNFGRIAVDSRSWDEAARIFWDVMDRDNPATVAWRSKAPWYFGERLEVPDYTYEQEYVGK